MTAEQRRVEIAERLRSSPQPITAAALARDYGVSRQIIVGDVALLRASGLDITSTTRGYFFAAAAAGLRRRLACCHDAAHTQAELNIMVDCGCTVVDVLIDHPVYGQLTAPLHLRSRWDVEQFIQRMEGASPLSQLTGGLHLHTLLCPDETTFHRLTALLREQGFLLE